MENKKTSTMANHFCKFLWTIVLVLCATNVEAQIGSLFGGSLFSKFYPITNHMVYEGKTKKKIPHGKGILHCTALDHTKYKDRYNDFFLEDGRINNRFDTRQDIILGVFNGNVVNNGIAKFWGYNGVIWSYKGDLIIQQNGENIEYVLLPNGIINMGGYDTLVKNEFTITDTVVVYRNMANFSIETPYITLITHTCFNTHPNREYIGIPSLFFNDYVTYFDIRYKEGWEYKCNSSYPGIKKDKSEQITYIVENCRTSKVIFGDESWYERYVDILKHEKVTFSAVLKDGTIISSADAKSEKISHAVIKFNNGDSYKGTIRLVTAKKGNRKADDWVQDIIPSILESETYYFKNISLTDNVIFIDGTYTYANGNVITYTDGYDDNERIEKEQKAQAARAAAQSRAIKSQQDREKKAANTRKLMSKLYGKTFSYNQYYDYYVAWSKHNGNASIKFSANRQDIFLRVGSMTTWLKLSEITDDGKLSCIETGSRSLADVYYITPYLDNGKISFIIDLIGGIKYRLSK